MSALQVARTRQANEVARCINMLVTHYGTNHMRDVAVQYKSRLIAHTTYINTIIALCYVSDLTAEKVFDRWVATYGG